MTRAGALTLVAATACAVGAFAGIGAAPASASTAARASVGATAPDPNRNRYCDHFDAPPPSGRAAAFDVGNGLTTQVNLDIETVAVRSGAGPTWDSTITGIDRYSIGPGWTLGTAFADVSPFGAKIYVPGHGLMESDQASVSGLSCYEGRDVVFRWDSGVVPGRGGLPDRTYMSTLAHFDEADLETPTRIEYFGMNGEVIATIDADGTRTDRLYDGIGATRLTHIVHDDGRETTFSYPDPTTHDRLTITSPDGANTALEIEPWFGPVRIHTAIGSTSITWTSTNLMHDLVSRTEHDVHGADFEWSLDDIGRLSELRVDGDRVFPLDAHPAP